MNFFCALNRGEGFRETQADGNSITWEVWRYENFPKSAYFMVRADSMHKIQNWNRKQETKSLRIFQFVAMTRGCLLQPLRSTSFYDPKQGQTPKNKNEILKFASAFKSTSENENDNNNISDVSINWRFDELLMNQSKILLKVLLESFNVFANAGLLKQVTAYSPQFLERFAQSTCTSYLWNFTRIYLRSEFNYNDKHRHQTHNFL